MTRVHGVGTDKPEAAGQARERVHDLGQTIRKVDQQGRPIATTIRKVCILDEDTGMHLPHMVRFLAIGLDALVDFYGIDRKAIPQDLTNE
jgi:hypothetical protein